MTYYTLVSKTVECPIWKDKITITAKYRFVDENYPYLAKFSAATCEVQENIKLPEWKRDKWISLYRFCDKGASCPLLWDFPDSIDVRNHNNL